MGNSPNGDYPRMMFHRTLDPVTIHSADQEADLGPEWSRIIWPAAPPEEPSEWAHDGGGIVTPDSRPKRCGRPPKAPLPPVVGSGNAAPEPD